MIRNFSLRQRLHLLVELLYDPPAMEQVLIATVIEGADLTKECSVTAGTPPLTVFWENVNSGQVIPGKLLNITNITRCQKEHRCIANNSCGSVWTTMFIYVQYKPAATYSSATIRLKSGEDRSIDCPVDIGNPPAVITWYKGNHTNCNKIATRSTSKVQNASSSDDGRYTCFAKNALGNTTINLLLPVVKPVLSAVSTPFETTPAGADYAPLCPLTRSWENPRVHVTIENIIGKGSFGQVAKGTAVGLRGKPETTTMGIKMLKSNAAESDERDLMKELETMKQLKPHSYVIKLMPLVLQSLLVLIEYVPFGDLLSYLRKSRGLNDTYYKDPDIKPQNNLTSQQLMKLAWQIAEGMTYLSSKSIIHRDLAARNELVGQKETCKVTDFGMASEVQDEIFMNERVRWSYGVVLYEIFTLDHLKNTRYQIIMKCWKNDPDARPTFTELKNQLKDMETQHKPSAKTPIARRSRLEEDHQNSEKRQNLKIGYYLDYERNRRKPDTNGSNARKSDGIRDGKNFTCYRCGGMDGHCLDVCAAADQHVYVGQAVVCKHGGFIGVVRHT
ncbi:Proto-oncogene tyrosine-protein kinase receptor Ret [Stylophora pistillata]|uniref:Proto-oncogene tyrosine-protein kinase receptor Ret n=1 Tax=Stylophora pistillata TaxID=50429 RepID=A0A2B4S5Z3_STYPI|nr:Proto-oncogene tyrosine-protein kinase receptor Ret [Stylophora pistillata]